MQHLDTKLNVDIGQLSGAGRKPDNEDAIGVRIPTGTTLVNKGVVAIVADGVSAAEAGKEASHTAVSSFISDYFSTHDSWAVKTSGLKVLTALNRWLYARGQNYPSAEKGYITTFSALILKSASAYLFHVGDSRIYRLRGQQFEQLTKDHSSPVGNGQRYLARALGIDAKLEIDFRRLDLEPGDHFLLTTDGVHDWLDNSQIEAIISTNQSPQNICQTLIDKALDSGSDDNLSAQLITVNQAGAAERSDILQSLTNLPFPPVLEIGSVIDNWKVIKELHATSRSEVYLVESLLDGSKAALKAPSANYQDEPSYIERFIQEEWIGMRIHSPHIVQVIRPRERKYLYYLTEYVEGPTLAQLIKERTRLPVTDARNIIMQVTSGIRAFHRKDCLHQDIKPDNIIYTEDGVKIIDFGSVHISGISEIDSHIQREKQLGTADYSAPEYKLNNPVSTRSDQFSLGVLAYELVTGKHPFGTGYAEAVNEKNINRQTYIPAPQLNPLVPVWMDGAIRRTLKFNPQHRYDSLSEFTQDLKKPNPRDTESRTVPLIDRNPMLFWQGLAVILLLTNLVLLALLTK